MPFDMKLVPDNANQVFMGAGWQKCTLLQVERERALVRVQQGSKARTFYVYDHRNLRVKR